MTQERPATKAERAALADRLLKHRPRKSPRTAEAQAPLNNALKADLMIVTPAMAEEWLTVPGANRLLSEPLVDRIADQIRTGRWRTNGDTIKLTSEGYPADGQHRLQAILKAGIAVQTLVVRGLEEDAFWTLDTIRKARAAADVIAMDGKGIPHRGYIATALLWLVRYRAAPESLEDYKLPDRRIENADIGQAFKEYSGIVHAADVTAKLRKVTNPGLFAFLYFIIAEKNEDLADLMVQTLFDPSSTRADDPFFVLRSYLVSTNGVREKREQLHTIALAIKAANAVHAKRRITSLKWRRTEGNPEPFPILDVG